MKDLKEFYIKKDGSRVRAEVVRECVKRWQKTEKGKEALKEYHKKNYLHLKNYRNEWFRLRRIEAKKNGECRNCFHKLDDKSYATCEKCRLRIIRNKKKWEASQ
jgi:hypothetical protein